MLPASNDSQLIGRPVEIIIPAKTSILTAPTKLFIELPLIQISPLDSDSSLQNVTCLNSTRSSPNRKHSHEKHHEEKNGKDHKRTSPRDLTSNGKEHLKTSPRDMNSITKNLISSCPDVINNEDEKKRTRRLSGSHTKELIREEKDNNKQIQDQAQSGIGVGTVETNATEKLRNEESFSRSFQSYSPPQVQRKEHSFYRKINESVLASNMKDASMLTAEEKLDHDFVGYCDKFKDDIKSIACSVDKKYTDSCCETQQATFRFRD